MSTVTASGSFLNGAESSESGSNLKAMVSCPDRCPPSREVAEKLMFFSRRRGMRKSDVQPAPRIRKSTDCMGFTMQKSGSSNINFSRGVIVRLSYIHVIANFRKLLTSEDEYPSLNRELRRRDF